MIQQANNAEQTAIRSPIAKNLYSKQFQPFFEVQEELLPIDEATLIKELQQTYTSETAHLPEVQLRYLILLILTEEHLSSELSLVASSIRQELNLIRNQNNTEI